jgi:hypothetical protein
MAGYPEMSKMTGEKGTLYDGKNLDTCNRQGGVSGKQQQ